MRVELPVDAWAIAGSLSEHAPDEAREDLPPKGTKRQGGRAPRLAAALCRRTLPSHAADTADTADTADPTDLSTAAVLFGTALGCLTETELFVEHMIRSAEATPKPRAFASSVHNAIASKAALELGARGECQTFVHGEVSFAHALFAAALVRSRSEGTLFVGAIDELTDYVTSGLRHCESAMAVGEGGAVLRITARGSVQVTDVAFGRPAEPAKWLRDEVTEPGAVCTVPTILGEPPTNGQPSPFASTHAALLASACALAVGILDHTVDPTALGITGGRPAAITLLGHSRFGDRALIRLALTSP